MSSAAALSPSRRYTFRGNLRSTRHGWLRLTPAYSVELVRELVDTHRGGELPVLDPFCGTGTTALACAEIGVRAVTIELNPFLVWLARAKVATFRRPARTAAAVLVEAMARAALDTVPRRPPVPSIHRIERWWSPAALGALGRAHTVLREGTVPERARDLATLAFCRALIDVANVTFGHQSMSFRTPSRAPSRRDVARALEAAFDDIDASAGGRPGPGSARVLVGDSRRADAHVGGERFGAVVTSPPYPNRMSYVRELRPYMYWLGFLAERRDAGELDWKAIGGTWGAATSRLSTWAPNPAAPAVDPGLGALVSRITARSPVLGAYVARYFEDMAQHVRSVAPLLAPGGTAHYVVGNAKFYDVVVPVEQLYGRMLESAGLEQVRVETLRKRTSKRELYEFVVSATAPDAP
jgi:hypothetical protein